MALLKGKTWGKSWDSPHLFTFPWGSSVSSRDCPLGCTPCALWCWAGPPAALALTPGNAGPGSLRVHSWAQAKGQKGAARAHKADTVATVSIHVPGSITHHIYHTDLCGFCVIKDLRHRTKQTNTQTNNNKPRSWVWSMYHQEWMTLCQGQPFPRSLQTRDTANSSKSLWSRRPLFWTASSLQDGTLLVCED